VPRRLDDEFSTSFFRRALWFVRRLLGFLIFVLVRREAFWFVRRLLRFLIFVVMS